MDDLSALLGQAVALHQQGRLPEAETAYRAFLRTAPDHPDALRLLGLTALQAGKAELAQARALRAATADPASADTWQMLGMVRRRLGALDGALAAYRRGCLARPLFPECHFNYGNALAQAERLAEAIVAYRTAAAQQPLNPSFWLNLSGALLRTDQIAAAVTAARAGLALEPGQPALLMALGRAERRRKQTVAAERAHGRAAALAPEREDFVYDHALALMEAGRPEPAAALFHTLLRSSTPLLRQGAKVGLHNISIRYADADELERAAAVLLSGADGAAVAPARVRIETSSACNLRCRHCTTGVAYRSTDRRLLHMSLFERILGELKSMDGLISCVMYLGGEPLMNPHLAVMIRRLRDETTAKQIHFVTNAMLATEERCRELVGSGVERIFISIDGRTPEENDYLRRGSHYPTVRDHIRLLRRYLEPAGVALVISNNILRRPDDPPTAVTPAFLRADFPGLPVVTNYAYKWPGWTQTEGEGEGENKPLTVGVSAARRRGFCSAPFNETVVRANGDVTMCCYDISGIEVMGRLADASIEDIWNGERYRAVRRAMLDRDEAALPAVCRRCPVYTGEELYSRV